MMMYDELPDLHASCNDSAPLRIVVFVLHLRPRVAYVIRTVFSSWCSIEFSPFSTKLAPLSYHRSARATASGDSFLPSPHVA